MALGRLSVVLDANIANFQSDLGRAARIADQQSRAMQKSFQDAATKIGAALAGAFAVDRMANFVKATIDANDALGKLSQKVGVSSETLSALGIEARKSGVDVGETQQAFVKLAQAATDSGSQGAKALAAMGISAKQFLALKPDQQFDLVARKFASYQDGARKAALATALFGKSGADLIPLLNDVGNKGLDSITQKAIKAGTAVDGDAVRAAQLFNDSLADLQDKLRGVVSQGLAQFTPAIEHISALMNSPDFQKNMDAVAQGIAGIAKASIDAANKLASLTRNYGEYLAKVHGGAASFDVPGMMQERDAIQGELKVRRLMPISSGVVGHGLNMAENAIGIGNISMGVKLGAMSTQDLQARLAEIDKNLLHAATQANAPAKNPQEGDMRGLFVGLGGNQAPIVDNGAAGRAAKLKALQDAYNALATAAQKANESRLTPDAKALADYTNGMRELAKAAGDYVAKGGDVAKAQKIFLEGQAGLWQTAQRAQQAATAAEKEFSDGLQHQLDLQKQAIANQVAAVGMGDKEAQRQQEINSLQQQGAEAVRQLTLERDKYLSTDPQYQVLTKHIQEQQAANDAFVKNAKASYVQLDAAQSNWANGFHAALANFNDQMNNTAEQMKGFTTNFIDGFANAFEQFASGTESAKKAFGSFIDSMLADALRWLANKAMQKLLDWATNSSGSGGSGFGSSGGSSGGTDWGSLVGDVASWFGGGKASGGTVSAGSLYRVNENGPELLTVAGKDFLMMGSQGGTVTPNSKLGGTTINNYTSVQPTSSRRTAEQVANAVARKQQLAMARA